MPDIVETIIIGAGVVGLATAAALADLGETVVFERHESFGRETSSRNSEVIHAGIYYPPGSLKARLCREGRDLLYAYCSRRGLPHRRAGKLIVANSPAECASLDDLLTRARANGVTDLLDLDAAGAARLEPAVRARRALYSPSTGLVDSHAFMAALAADACEKGVLFAYCHHLLAIEPRRVGFRVTVRTPAGTLDTLNCRLLINSAGLEADSVAALAGIDTAEAGYRQYPCKGEYFSLPPARARLLRGLVYPPPLQELTGLGIHATKTLDGRLRLGPNALYDPAPDYTVDPARAGQFFEAVKPFLPFVEQEDLVPEMAGIRPKLSPPGGSFRDFVIREESDRGLPGLVNLLGIESPGLTASLAIARRVSELLSPGVK